MKSIACIALSCLALEVFGAPSTARLGVKGGQYDVNGYNPQGFDVFGFTSNNVDKWGRPASDPKAGLIPPEGRAASTTTNTTTATTTSTNTATTTTSATTTRCDPTRRRHHRHHRHTKRHPEPTPFITPIPYTTINGTVVPHPTHVFPIPTPTEVCGGVIFYVNGYLTEEQAKDYLAAVAVLSNITYEDIQLMDLEPIPSLNQTAISTIICGQAFLDVYAAAIDPIKRPLWIRLGSMKAVFVAPNGSDIETVVFQCPDGYYYINNVCIPCFVPVNSTATNNCTQIVCTSPYDTTCKYGACETGYYNGPGNSDCQQCASVANCNENSTVCSYYSSSVCQIDGCYPPYVFSPPGVCV